ncbi:winged helix-turn-helix transcriptional regulator [Sphingomonas sp.]|jgi:DNA-binding HxlR family transcriptional regulator|uniref:winged helix-turn-helix transcriptional regulator n=1 Tax=Sphingomonas sp. TaxID=28214 RepID=UPI0035C7D39E
MKTYVASKSPCPVGRASRLLGDRWIVLMLRELFLGVDRFDGFLERLPISRATLTARLEWLVAAGVVTRDPPEARRARYRLTEAGRALRPVLAAIRDWGEAWLPQGTTQEIEKAPGPSGPDAPRRLEKGATGAER